MGETKAVPPAKPAPRRRCRGREFVLTPWHLARLQERVDEQQIKPSEALRQIIHENHQRGSDRQRAAIRQHVSLIKAHCQLLRAKPSMLLHGLMNIEQAAEEILKLATSA
jgi:hypothetical protein